VGKLGLKVFKKIKAAREIHLYRVEAAGAHAKIYTNNNHLKLNLSANYNAKKQGILIQFTLRTFNRASMPHYKNPSLRPTFPLKSL